MNNLLELADKQNKLGIKLATQGNFHQAIKYFKKAKDIYPFSPYTHYYLGLTYQQLKKDNQALASYQKAIELKPDYTIAHNNMGVLYLENNNYKEAEKHFQSALSSDPHQAMALTNLGNIYKLLNRLNEAIACYQKALKINPKLCEAHNNLGVTLINLGQFQEAKESLEKAVKLKSDYTEAYYHLGIIETELGKLETAIKNFEKALLLNPDYTDTLNMYATALMKICDWEKLKKIFNKLDKLTKSELGQDKKTSEAPFLNLIRSQNPKINFAVAKSWSNLIKNSITAYHPPFAFKKNSLHKRIKIGYLSFDFRDHAVSHQIFGLFGLHDRKKFEIYTYSYGPDGQSQFRKTIQRNSDKFRGIQNIGNVEAAKKIHQDGIDILVDLAGHTKNSRLEICSLRPAPIQITYLGFPGTTGADFFDYVITDKIITPPGSARYYSEKFVFLPDCYQVSSYAYLKNLPEPRNRDYGLPSKSVIFCSFNNSYKIQEKVFLSWMRILKKVPNSLLWLLKEDEISQKNLLYQAQKKGVNQERFIFAPRIPLEQHLQRLTVADISLDTFPYNGGATTSNALWAGVPVIALMGKTYITKMSSSLLKAIGLPELITKTAKDYEDLAVYLANNPAALKKLKEKLAKNRLAKPLFDTKRFVKNLEKAYIKIWENYLAGKKLQQIEIREDE